MRSTEPVILLRDLNYNHETKPEFQFSIIGSMVQILFAVK